MNSVGKRLKEIRTNNNITQEKIAEILNTNRVRISNIENGKIQMYFNEALVLCQKFNISADSFFEEKNLSSEDFIKISDRFIKNNNISFVIRRETLRKIHLNFENEAFKNDSNAVSVLDNNNISIFDTKSNKFDIE